MNITVQDLLEIPFSHEVGVQDLEPSQTFRGVSTDSRSITNGDLFIALSGPRFDGHHYVEQVASAGAIAAVVSEHWFSTHSKKHEPLPMIVVKEPARAFGLLAGIYRKKFNIPVLVVAGSNGKTTTKELIAHILSSEMDVLKSEANFNNHIGVPHTLFRLREGHHVAVIEIGTNHPGEIAWLCEVAQPTLALITNIGREHLEFLKNKEGVAREEKSAFDYVLEHEGMAFLNMDDPYLRPLAHPFDDRAITYATGDNAAFVRAETLGFSKEGRLGIRVHCQGKSFRVQSRLVAEYAPNLIAAAISVGLHFNLSRSEIRKQIEAFHPHDKRLDVQQITWQKLPATRQRSSTVTVLNDSYNANPDSMMSALRSLVAYPATGRRFAVLGDMFELGDASAREHRALGKKLATLPIDGVLLTGNDMELASHSYRTAPERTGDSILSYFKHKTELAKQLKEILRPGDVLLLKGSRGMKMEEVLELIQK